MPLGVVMSVGAVALFLWPARWASKDFLDHRVFWLLQTWDRWSDGAPPRTDTEVAQRRTLVADLEAEQGVHDGGEPIGTRA